MAILVVCGAAVAVWVLARGDLVGDDARAYWGGVRLWLAAATRSITSPYLPYVYWSGPAPFAPWAALPWETAWFVYRVFNVILLGWSVAWAYRQHPLATALLFLLITPALAATLDTGNVTFLCAMGIWAAHFVGPRLGGFLWALAAALKWFPALLFLILPPRTRLWGIGWAALFGILTLATWPQAVRQLDLVIGFPRPLRIDYLLLVWAAVPWIWAHPSWFEWRTWDAQVREAGGPPCGPGRLRRSPRRLGVARDATCGVSTFGLTTGLLGTGSPAVCHPAAHGTSPTHPSSLTRTRWRSPRADGASQAFVDATSTRGGQRVSCARIIRVAAHITRWTTIRFDVPTPSVGVSSGATVGRLPQRRTLASVLGATLNGGRRVLGCAHCGRCRSWPSP
jgi:hypothetical protein